MAKDMLDKMEMPKKAGMEDEMLEFDESDMDMEGEAPASGMDLSVVSDDELLMEAKKRGLLPEDAGMMDEMGGEDDYMME